MEMDFFGIMDLVMGAKAKRLGTGVVSPACLIIDNKNLATEIDDPEGYIGAVYEVKSTGTYISFNDQEFQ